MAAEVSSQPQQLAPPSSEPEAPSGGFMGRLRRFSHDVLERMEATPASQENIEELVRMGFPRGPAARQLSISHNNVRVAAESLVHAAHPKDPNDAFNHPECPICVREKNNVRIAEGRRLSINDAFHRVTSRGKTPDESPFEEGDAEGRTAPEARRGSVSAMLRRSSVAEGLRRMRTRDVGRK